MKVMPQGQCLQHSVYGIGIATASDAHKTTIDFYEHGPKTFITEMLEAVVVAEAPPRPPRSRSVASLAAKKAATKK
jgi:hypothetical protein